MKKCFFLLITMMLVGFATNTKAQQYQLLNNRFEDWDNNGVPNYWHTTNTASGSLSGMLPSASDLVSKVSGTRPGGTGGYYLKLRPKNLVLALANGTITTGRMNAGNASASNEANHNWTDRSGGYCQSFTATPDSVYFWVCFYATTTSAKASIRFYIHGDMDFKDHDTGGDNTDPSKYNRKAKVDFTRTTSSSSTMVWEQKKEKFEIGSSSCVPAYVLGTLTTNVTAGGGNKNDVLYVDDIEFIYSAWATNIAFQGNNVPGFSKGNFGDYVVSVNYVSDLDNLTPSDFVVTTEVDDVREKTVSYVEESGFTYNGRPARRAKIHIVAEDGTTTKDYYVVIYAINDDPNYYTISATADDASHGTVTGGGNYMEGSSVTLTATANTGYDFSQWNDGNTTNPRTISVTADANYVAQFVPQQFTITVNANPAEGGVVTGGDTYDYNATATLTATANTGYEFVNWSDGNTNASRIVTVTENATYTANFQLQSYTVSATVSPAESGTVTGTGSYTYGSSATLTATPAEDYHFLQWSDGTTTTTNTFTVTENTSLIAYFAMDEITYYNVEVVSASTLMGSVSGGGSVRDGRTTVISATPNTGYYFTQWNDGNTDNPRTITVTGNVTYTASFAPYSYTITAESADESMGTVTGGGEYDYAETATLTAVPETGFRFVEWDDHITQNPRTVSVTGNATYTATFEQITFTVNAIANNASYGTVTGSGIYNYGAAVSLTASAVEGYHFVQWNDGTTANPYQFNIFENKNITAIFEEDGVVITYYTVTVSANNAAMGSVTGGGSYAENTTATIEAVAENGYEFVEWNDHVTTNPRSFTVTSDVEFVATFQAINYELTVVANPAEGGVVTGGGSYPYGTTTTITAAANLGYEFTGWNDGILASSRQVTVSGPATYTANFAQEEYQINVTVSNAAYGTATGSGTYHYGDMVTATASANSGFRFVQWSNGVMDNPYTFAAQGSMTLVAEFANQEVEWYNVTATSANTEMGGVSGAGSYPAGTTVTVEALPNYGYRFVQWQDGETVNPRTFVINSDMTFTATFAADNFTVTVTSNDPTMGTVAGSGTYTYMTQINVVATPNDGYHFDHWEGADAINNSKAEAVTLPLTVDRDITLMAVFVEDEVVYYTITVASSNESMGTASGGGVYRAGDTIEIQATPNSNYAFARWREDGNVDNPRTIIVEGNRTFTAIFQYTGAVSGAPNGHVVAWCQGGRLFVKGVENHDVIVTDMMGRVVYRAEQCLFDSFDIDVQADGIYLVHVDGVATKKVYVRR